MYLTRERANRNNRWYFVERAPVNAVRGRHLHQTHPPHPLPLPVYLLSSPRIRPSLFLSLSVSSLQQVYLEGGNAIYTCSMCRAHLATRDHVVSEVKTQKARLSGRSLLHCTVADIRRRVRPLRPLRPSRSLLTFFYHRRLLNQRNHAERRRCAAAAFLPKIAAEVWPFPHSDYISCRAAAAVVSSASRTKPPCGVAGGKRVTCKCGSIFAKAGRLGCLVVCAWCSNVFEATQTRPSESPGFFRVEKHENRALQRTLHRSPSASLACAWHMFCALVRLFAENCFTWSRRVVLWYHHHHRHHHHHHDHHHHHRHHHDHHHQCFHGHGGRAFLFERCVNVAAGRPEDRLLMTGMHVVADISCKACGAELGWKYVSYCAWASVRTFVLSRKVVGARVSLTITI